MLTCSAHLNVLDMTTFVEGTDYEAPHSTIVSASCHFIPLMIKIFFFALYYYYYYYYYYY
jgi:hypothetical protein